MSFERMQLIRQAWSVRRAMFLILLLAFALRMVVAVNNLDTALAGDEDEYLGRAKIVATDIRADTSSFHPPLYPYALAVVLKTIGDARFIISTYHALLDVLSVALVYLLARLTILRKDISLLAALWYAVFPTAIGLTGTILSDTQAMCLALGGLVMTLRAVKHSRLGFALAGGILLALAAMTREVFAYFALVVIPLWWLLFTNSSLRVRLLHVVVFMLGMLLLLIPNAIRTTLVEGRFLLLSSSSEYNFARDNVRAAISTGFEPGKVNTTGRQFMFGELEAQPRATRTMYAYQRGWNAIMQAGWYWLGSKAKDLRAFWNPFHLERQNLGLLKLPPDWSSFASFAISGYLVALFAFATFGSIVAPDSSAKLLLALFLLYSLVIFLVTHYQLRYRYPVLVLLMPYAAYGVWFVCQMLFNRKQKLQSLLAARVVLAVLTLLVFAPLVFRIGQD
jgi:4-amino-4-deoxy-L-arabinose transferase-like glycosyltransferase